MLDLSVKISTIVAIFKKSTNTKTKICFAANSICRLFINIWKIQTFHGGNYELWLYIVLFEILISKYRSIAYSKQNFYKILDTTSMELHLIAQMNMRFQNIYFKTFGKSCSIDECYIFTARPNKIQQFLKPENEYSRWLESRYTDLDV